MLIKDNFFRNNFVKSKKCNNAIKKTKKVFGAFLADLENFKIPLLSTNSAHKRVLNNIMHNIVLHTMMQTFFVSFYVVYRSC